MANLKDLIVSGPARFLNKIYGNLDGNATSADKVNNNLIINWGSGTTDGVNSFTYNGSSAKTITITPSAIGAAESGHTHYYAGSSSIGGVANSALTVGQGNDPNVEFDANTITVPVSKKTFYSTNSSKMANRPSGTNWGYLDVGAYSSSYMMQTFINGDNANIYARVKYNNTWKDWKQVAFVDTKVNTATAAEKLVNSSGTALTIGSSTQPIYFSNGVPVAITGTINNNAASATLLQTARTFNVSGGATGTAQTFNGAGNVSIPITAVKESYLTWGGKNFSDSYGCIDAAMVPELGANRLMFGKAEGITIQYSTDAGNTWNDYGATDSDKVALFSSGKGFNVGKANKDTLTTNCMLRVIIDTNLFQIYSQLNKFVIYVSTNGSNGCYCTIDASLESTPTVFTTFADRIPISGWSGYNVINTSTITTYGNSPSYQYGLIRFTFGFTSIGSTSYSGLSVSRILGFGGVGWTVPSNMARNGHLYSYDSSQNATFPAKVTASNGGFKGNLDGTAEYAKLLSTARSIQTKLDSTSSASFNGGSNITPGVTGTLGIGNGGTGTSTAPTQWGIIYASSTTAYASTAAGTSGYLLQSNATSAPSWIKATNANEASTIVKRNESGNFSAGTITANLNGNATSAGKVGASTNWLYFNNSNEVNFGGSDTSTTIYMGYRKTDSREIPVKFIFGNKTGTADLQAKTVYLGSSTTSYISSTQYTGNAASANKVNKSLTIQFNGSSSDTHKFIYDGSVEKTVNITPEGIGASAKAHTHEGVYAPLNNGIIPSSYLPSYVDDVLEYNGISNFPSTGESGKIYVDTSTNLTYRWSGSTYTEISKSLALGETNTTAFRGDLGNTAYTHATAKGSAFSSGLYKITTNAQGHVTNAVAVAKADITGLGIPAQDTVYTHPTTSGNKHIPSGGSSGQILRWSADGTAVWGADNNTDTKVTQTAITASDYTNWRPLIWGASNSGSEGFTPDTKTDGVFTAQTLSCQPSSGTIKANIFKGNLSGNAETATKLQNERAINGTAFDGTKDIITAKWGEERNITIGNTTKGVNGSKEVYSWDLNEIGALPGKTSSATTGAAAGWYRIASTEKNQGNNLGQFIIQASLTGAYCTVMLNAGISFGIQPILQQMSFTHVNKSCLTKARIVYNTYYYGTYAYLEVYLSEDSATEINISYTGKGWNLISPNTVGSIPSNYTSKEITFVSETIVSNLSGNATTADSFSSNRTIKLTGNVIGTASSNGSSGWSISTTYNSIVPVNKGGTGTSTAPTQGGVIYASSTGAYASTTAGSSGQLLQSAGTGKPTWITATNSNTASTIVKRDGSGNFSAGTITANLNGSATTVPKALISNGTSATTNAGYIYGVAGSTTSGNRIYSKWYVNLDNSVKTLTDGMLIEIKIPVAGSSSGCAITIDNGANFHPVIYGSSSILTTHFGVNNKILLMYDSSGTGSVYGTIDGIPATSAASITGAWRVMNLYTDGNTYTSAYCSTSASNAAKSATCSGYYLLPKSQIHIIITTTNTAASALTLNINGQGAKPIYINGTASSSSNYTLPRGSYLVYYDGTNYYFRTDGAITGNLIGKASSADILNGISSSSTFPTSSIGDGKIKYYYNINDENTGMFSSNSNANSIIQLSRHHGNYDSQLGFSSNGNIYYRSFNDKAIDTTSDWKKIVFVDTDLNEIGAYDLANRGAEIPEGFDLNTYKTAGNYYVSNSDRAKTIVNTPFDGNGYRLICQAGYGGGVNGHGYQIAFGSSNLIKFRICNGSTWGDWTSYSKIGHTHSYLPLSGGTMTGSLQIGNSDSTTTTAEQVGIKVRDLRAVSMTPNTLGDQTAVFYFHQAGPAGKDDGWKSILRVKGWAKEYASWELAGPAGSTDTKEFYVRSGLGTAPGDDKWGDWRKLLTDDNYTQYTVTKEGVGASGKWKIEALRVGITTENPSSASSWYIPFNNGKTSASDSNLSTNNGLMYLTKEGTATVEGYGSLRLGNAYTTGNTGNKTGNIYMYGTSSAYTKIAVGNKTTDNNTVILPSRNGTIALTTDTHYGTCDTAAGTTAKVVNLTDFTLVTGAKVAVKFTKTNTASSPTLNVNDTGAKKIYYRGSAISAGYLAANRVYEFVYDGTNYELIGDINTNAVYSVNGQTGTVILDYSDVGAAASNHTHTYSDVGAAASSHTHSNYLSLSGGTMTGTIITPGDNSYGIRPATANYGRVGTENYYFYEMYSNRYFLKGSYAKADMSSGTLQVKTIFAPTTDDGDSYGAGSDGQVLKSNGSTVYWGTVSGGTSYTLLQATNNTLGGVKIGYFENGKNYPVELNTSGQMYVNVPWTDTDTTYSAGTGLSLSAANKISVNLNSTTSLGAISETNKIYAVGVDNYGKLCVKVPWTSTSTSITDYCTLSTAQTITGVKTFNASPIVTNSATPKIMLIPNSTNSGNTYSNAYVEGGSSDVIKLWIDSNKNTSSSSRRGLELHGYKSKTKVAESLRLRRCDTSGNWLSDLLVYHQGNIVYSSTEPSSTERTTGMIWLKPI